jgi:hypothetical protein
MSMLISGKSYSSINDRLGDQSFVFLRKNRVDGANRKRQRKLDLLFNINKPA